MIFDRKRSFGDFRRMRFSGLFAVISLLACISSLAPPALGAAACIKGLPCVVGLTPNDPFVDTDGPNAAGAPNAHWNEPIPNKVCDADLLNQMTAKAFLEAEREMVVANASILKPDSVLEYTCLDQAMARSAEVAGPIFSETDHWHPITVPIGEHINGTPVPSVEIDVFTSDTYLDDILEPIVMDAIKTYVDANFWHDFLGGAAAGDDNNIADTVNGVSNVCDFMYNVFFVSKCSDFALEAPLMTFEELVGNDPRTLPNACGSMHKITQDLIDLANNKNDTYAAKDPVDLLLEKFLPPGGSVTCSDPIPTGVIVQHTERSQDLAGNPVVNVDYAFPEQHCPNPACHLDNKGNASAGDDECVPP